MTEGPRVYRFGPFSLDSRSLRLTRGDELRALAPRHVDLLILFVTQPSVLIAKEALIRHMWPDVAVTDNALTQAISELREALDDDASAPAYIQTVPRRGYRFIAAVHVDAQDGNTGTAAVTTGSAPTLGTRTIGVADFVDVTRDEAWAWLASGIAETVTSDLRALAGLRVVDRARVADAMRRTSSLAGLSDVLQVDLLVSGSFQRAGTGLRITARIMDRVSGECVATAKVDGPVADVFALQDALVAQFARSLGMTGAARTVRHETASLEAYRAFTEGRLKLEALDPSLVSDAIELFGRAIALDPRYALPHVGLANAYSWLFEMSRARNEPDAPTLAQAIDCARRAIALDPEAPEAHATLSFLLVAGGRGSEALSAARRAVALEPGNWAHQYRLGHASWGEGRLIALRRALALYSAFAYAYFESAMVHVARGDLQVAEEVLREGMLHQTAPSSERFPARGLHWLIGLIRLSRGDVDEAERELALELRAPPRQLHSAEFSMNAHDALGFAALVRSRPTEGVVCFRRALDFFPRHARSRAGLALALREQGLHEEAAHELREVDGAVDELTRGGRSSEAALAAVFALVLRDRPDEAVAALRAFVSSAPPGFAGWTIPLEPLLRPLHSHPGFEEILAIVARRAE